MMEDLKIGTSRNTIEDTLFIKAGQLRAGNVFKEYDGSNAPCNYWLHLVVSVEDYDSDRVKVSFVNISPRVNQCDFDSFLRTELAMRSYFNRNKLISIIVGRTFNEKIDTYFTTKKEQITCKIAALQSEIDRLTSFQKELEDLRKKSLFT